MLQDKKNRKIIAIFISIIVILLFLGVGFLVLSQISKIKTGPKEPGVQGELYSSNFEDQKELDDWEIIDATESENGHSEWKISNGALISEGASTL